MHRDKPLHEEPNEGIQSDDASEVIWIYHSPVRDEQGCITSGCRINRERHQF
jgi:hypothetical protein